MSISRAFRRLLPMLVILPLGLGPEMAAARPQAPQATEPNISELRLDAALIGDFLRVIYFGDDGRFHFREYSTCSYQFIQNPAVSVEDGLVHVTAEYYARRGTEALGGCAGGPGTSTAVTMSARLSAQGSTMAFEILEVKTESMPRITAALLDLAGVTLPMTHNFDLMAAMNRMLHENQPFGVSSLDIHEVLVEDESVRLRLTMQLGIW